MTAALLLERIWPALPIADAFWLALANDDEAALASLLSPAWDDVVGPDFASRYRAEREIAAETCRVVGLFTRAELLASDRIRLRYSIADRPRRVDPGQSVVAWPLELVEVDGRWLVDRPSDRAAIQEIDLKPMMATDEIRRADESPGEFRN